MLQVSLLSLSLPLSTSLVKLKVASRIFWLLIKQSHSQIAMVPQSREPTPRATAIRDSCSPALRVILGETRTQGRFQWNQAYWRVALFWNCLEGFMEFSSTTMYLPLEPKHFIKQGFYIKLFARRAEFIIPADAARKSKGCSVWDSFKGWLVR